MRFVLKQMRYFAGTSSSGPGCITLHCISTRTGSTTILNGTDVCRHFIVSITDWLHGAGDHAGDDGPSCSCASYFTPGLAALNYFLLLPHMVMIAKRNAHYSFHYYYYYYNFLCCCRQHIQKIRWIRKWRKNIQNTYTRKMTYCICAASY